MDFLEYPYTGNKSDQLGEGKMHGHYYSVNGDSITTKPSIKFTTEDLDEAITEALACHEGSTLIIKSLNFATLSLAGKVEGRLLISHQCSTLEI